MTQQVIEKEAERSQVPCNGCRKCCQNDTIMLHPEEGDDPANYETIDIINPLNGQPAKMLPHKANGDCHYLGEQGCTIYEKRPAICRTFDCRMMAACMPYGDRERLLKQGALKREVINQGRKLAHTMTDDEAEACNARRKELLKGTRVKLTDREKLAQELKS